jgi:hypothetical protein
MLNGPFRRVLALDPKDVETAENLALVFEAENRSADADRVFPMAVTLAGDAPHTGEWPYSNYASFLLDPDRAAEPQSAGRHHFRWWEHSSKHRSRIALQATPRLRAQPPTESRPSFVVLLQLSDDATSGRLSPV